MAWAALPASAVEVIPTLTAGAFYTDNVLLAPPGQESDDLIGLVQPGVRITSAGQRHDFSLDYRLQALFYNEQSDSDTTFSLGRTQLGLQLLPERFILTGLASISQTIIDPQEVIPGNNLPITANRQDQVEMRVTPEWRQPIGDADLRLAYTRGVVSFESDAFRDVDFNEFNNSLVGPQRDRGLTWRVSHFYGGYDYQVVEIKRQTVDLFLFAEMGSGWAPFVSVGTESDFAEPTSADLNYFTWSAGLRRNTERTRVEASYGDRSFGKNVNFLLQRQLGSRDGDFIRASYSESPRNPATLQGVALPVFGDPVPVPPGGIDPDLDPGQTPVILPPGLAQSFLTKRGQIVVSKEFIRSLLSLTIFVDDFTSIPFGSDIDEATTKTRQQGVAGAYTYRVGAKVSLKASLRYADREFQSDGEIVSADDLFFGRLGLEYQLGPKTSITTFLGTDRQLNREGQVLNREYEQNIAGVTLTRTFF